MNITKTETLIYLKREKIPESSSFSQSISSQQPCHILQKTSFFKGSQKALHIAKKEGCRTTTTVDDKMLI